MRRTGLTRRTVAALLLVGLVVAAAGCTAIGTAGEPGDDGSGDDGAADDDPTTGADSTATEATTAATATPSTTTGADSAGDGHDHDHGHSHGNATTAESDDSTTSPATDGNGTTTGGESANVSGQLTVVVGAVEVTAGESVETDDFRFEAADAHRWTAETGTTLAEALAAVGVEAVGPTALAYDGTTYRDGEGGVAVDVRVNGEPTDPTSHVLRDGDEVWVTVETPEMDRETPGEYVRAADHHVHGEMDFVVNGTAVDFSEPRYQSGHRHFHFEGGHADPWHAHSFGVTLGYAMGTLDGIEVAAGAVTYDGTTYRDADPGTTVAVSVNGEPVEPASYYLKDGDEVEIVVETDA